MEERSEAEKLENLKNLLGYSEDNQRSTLLSNRPQQGRKGSDSRASHVGGCTCVNDNVHISLVYHLRDLDSEEVRIVSIDHTGQMDYKRIFYTNFLRDQLEIRMLAKCEGSILGFHNYQLLE